MKTIQLPKWHRGLHALHFSFLSGLIVVTFLASLTISVISPRWIQQADAAVSPFSSGSFWNSPVPAYTQLDADSAALVSNIANQASQFGSSFTTNTSSPVYIVEPDTPLVSVIPWDCGAGSLPDLTAQWQSVPLPFFAVPSTGPNSQMIIYQPSSGTVWEFGHMRNTVGQWEACTGGRTTTSGEGVFPAPYGVSSSGLALLAGQLRIDELKSGYIDHAIGLSLPQTNGFTSPATQGNGSHGDAPAMGTRLRLDPALNLQSLGLNPPGLAIARAAQTYGFVIWNTSPTVSVSGENAASYLSRGLPDPYANIPGANNALNNFPWDKLQVLPEGNNYNTAVPAITQFTASQTTVKSGSKVTLEWQSSNVNRCAVAGVGDNLPARGTVVTSSLTTNTTFVLRCGGPAGVASSQASVTVTKPIQNDSASTLAPALTIDQPYTGYANILPELMSVEAAESIYKVVYYEAESYLFETAKPPYALNTARMNNGKYVVDAQIYYRDGRTDRKSIGIMVNNSPETLFATVQSGVIKAPPSIPLPFAIVGVILALSGMAIGSWWGWHKAHLT